MNRIRIIINQLAEQQLVEREDLIYLIDHISEADRAYLYECAFEKRKYYYGREVFLRGLIEISNYCPNTCKYCGIRGENCCVERYRLSYDEVMECVDKGYVLGFRSFVIQGGEDPYLTDELMTQIIKEIKHRYSEVAVTLSLGERSAESYQNLYNAGADRYLLRIESATKSFYEQFHPGMSYDYRLECLHTLKRIGFQTGTGFLFGLPGQTSEHYADDVLFAIAFKPQMVGCGPFIPQHDTPLANEPRGTVEQTLLMYAIYRLVLPEVLLPATTSLATIDPAGRDKAFAVGANVVMPNLSPYENRAKYALYDGKKFASDESAEEVRLIKKKIEDAGFIPAMTRGDHKLWEKI